MRLVASGAIHFANQDLSGFDAGMGGGSAREPDSLRRELLGAQRALGDDVAGIIVEPLVGRM